MNPLAVLPVAACLCAAATATVRAAPIDVADTAGGNYALHIVSLKEARFQRTVRQRYDFSCGSAAVATLLTYQYGYPTSEQTAFMAMFIHGDQQKIRREGFSLLDIKRFLASIGFDADGFDLPLDKLAETHTPAIVLITENGYHHFVVVKGMRNGRVLVGDPAAGTRAVPRDAYEAKWRDHVLFVIRNRHEQARFNDPADWRVAPAAPLASGVERRGLGDVVLPKFGPGDF